MGGQDVFIDETRCYKAPHKSRAANSYDRLPRLGLEFPDPFGKIAVDDPRFGPRNRGGRLPRPGSKPLYPFLVKTALGISFIGQQGSIISNDFLAW